MKDMIKDIFKIAGHEIDFSDVDYSFEGLPCKLSSLLRSKSQNQIETTVCDSLRERWNGIESGSKEFVCYEEIDGMLRPCHVGVGQGIPFYPCVFILNCNLLMSQGKEIYLRIKIEKTQSPYIASVYGVTYEYKVSQLFVCDENGNSLLGFSQMPFLIDRKGLYSSLSKIYGKKWIDKRKLAKNVYESWIKCGMPKDSDQHLTFETGLQTNDGRNVQVILWKDAPTDDGYEFRVIMGSSSLKKERGEVSVIGETSDFKRDQNEEEDSQQRDFSCDSGWDAAEIDFLSAFEEYVNACGFKYETADLVRLHTSIKCSMCTLLAGNPGTGKSSLAELYMRVVAGSPEKDEVKRSWRQIFVNPAWMEPADLLGYETDSGDFKSAPSKLVKFIRQISDVENLPMGIVCFEEMNLACVEYYFSDFIQIISRGEGMIPGCKEENKDLWVGRNFRVIGTCNSDATTRPLSPRFLSRCNTIELSNSFATTKSLVTDLANGKTPKIEPFIGSAPITYKDFKHWYESSCARAIDDGIVNAILTLLEPKDKDGGESFMSSAGFDMSGRIVSDMYTYIRNRPPYKGGKSILTEHDRQKVALDEFLAQRVFFACRPTPGTITAISILYNEVNNGSTIFPKLPLSAALLKRRIDDYNKRIMQV